MNRLGIKQKEFEGFQLQRAIIGPIATNVLFLINTNTKEILLVDPAEEAPRLIQYIKGQGFSLKGILLTHGHEDHTGAADDLCEMYGCRLYMHPADLPLIDPANSRSGFCFPVYTETEDPGKRITTVAFTADVYHTPGHTAGSVCYRIRNHLFTGDTLFACDIGRTDLFSGSEEDMKESLRFLQTLPKDLAVEPGHGPSTTLSRELKNNPYFSSEF